MKKSHQGQKQLCKELYFKYRSVDEIALQTGVNLSTLLSWVHGRTKNDPSSWRHERDTERMEVLKESFSRRMYKIEDICNLTIDFIHSSIKKRTEARDKHNKEIPFSMRESRAAMDIVMDMEKLRRLEEGTPTDIMGVTASVSVQDNRACTMLELRNTILNDPFMRGVIPLEITDDRAKEPIQHEQSKPIEPIPEGESGEWSDILESPGIQESSSGHSEPERGNGFHVDDGAEAGVVREESDSYD